MKKKTPILVSAAVAALLACGGGGTAFAMSNEVTVDVYGEQTTIRTFDNQVQDILTAHGVDVKDSDLVQPALTANVNSGETISVVERHEVTVDVDGHEQTVLTDGDTVADALALVEADYENAQITPAPETPLTDDLGTVSVVLPKNVTFVGMNGEWTAENTYATTVQELLDAHFADSVDADDVITPGRDTRVTDGLVVTIQRTGTTEETAVQAIDYETETRTDDSKYEDETTVLTAGVKGEKTVTTRTTVTDGEVTAQETIAEEVTREPVTEVVVKGTKKRPAAAAAPAAPSSGGSSSSSGSNTGASAPAVTDGSVWDRLAQCESTGNWSINNGNGFSGGLQFTRSTWAAYGGTRYAPEAWMATREQQIDIAKNVQAGQGWGAWPACTRKLGLR